MNSKPAANLQVSNICGYALSLAMLNTVAAPPTGWLPIFASDTKALFARTDIALDDILETAFTILLQKLPGADKTEFMLARQLADKLIAERSAQANGTRDSITERRGNPGRAHAAARQRLERGSQLAEGQRLPRRRLASDREQRVLHRKMVAIVSGAHQHGGRRQPQLLRCRYRRAVGRRACASRASARVRAPRPHTVHTRRPLAKTLLVYRKHPEVIQARDGGRSARVGTPRPFVPSASFKAASGSGDGIEILSVGKQFVVHGMHVEAGQPYRWIGECNPLEDTTASAPLVSQEQVDAFLAAVRRDHAAHDVGGGAAGNGGDAARHVNADGLIDDGRENFLRDCIWRAANEIDGGDTALTGPAVASRGWELFEERAWNGDGKYSYEKHALSKAQLLLRRVNDGRVKLNAVPEASPTHAVDGGDDGVRSKLRATLLGFQPHHLHKPEEDEAMSDEPTSCPSHP